MSGKSHVIKYVKHLDVANAVKSLAINWGKASDSERSAYTDNCSELLGNIQLPREAVCCSLASCDDISHIHSIASLYSDIVNCLHCAASGVIPITKCNCMSDEHNTPGWNEYVKDAHSEARDAFKLWVQSSKPRQGDVFQSMKQSRARFKFKLRQCKREEARVRADILAMILLSETRRSSGNMCPNNIVDVYFLLIQLVEPLVVTVLLACGKRIMQICSIVWIALRTKNLF